MPVGRARDLGLAMLRRLKFMGSSSDQLCFSRGGDKEQECAEGLECRSYGTSLRQCLALSCSPGGDNGSRGVGAGVGAHHNVIQQLQFRIV